MRQRWLPVQHSTAGLAVIHIGADAVQIPQHHGGSMTSRL
jgi:hypothetical protein